MKLCLSLFAAALIFPALGQGQPEISFSETSYNFGLVKEEDGPVDHTFLFVNKGKQPLMITGVSASCGCTTSGWSADTIAPGKLGFVKARFDPFNRPGAFKKSLTVASNGDPNIVSLYIEGFVRAKPRSIADEFPAKQGALRLKYASLNMGSIKNNSMTTRGFEVYNDSDAPLIFTKEIKKPGNIDISFNPDTLQPYGRGSIVASFDPSGSELGYTAEDIVIRTLEAEGMNEKNLRIVGVVEDYFPPMTAEELAKAPSMNIDRTSFDFGSVAAGSKIKADFTVSNTGKEELTIKKVRSSCDCIEAVVEKNSLKKNEQAVITAIFDTTGLEGSQTKTVAIFTNDPRQPMKVMRISGKVN